VVSSTPRPYFTPGKDPVPIVQEAGWAPGPVWTGAENLAPTGIRSPDHPAHSQSLYRLSYPAHLCDLYSSPNIIWVKKSRRNRCGMWHTWGRGEMCTGFWWGNLRERDNLGDTGIDCRIMLKLIFK
jgi:hypothetical protein